MALAKALIAPGAEAEATPLARRRSNVPAAIDVRGLSRRFGETTALDEVTLRVEAGSVHGLLGPNGAGKTTLLRCLVGLTRPDSGSARVLGLEPARTPRELRRRVAVIPSGDRSFYLRISGLENLVFFARLHGLSRRAPAPPPARGPPRGGPPSFLAPRG